MKLLFAFAALATVGVADAAAAVCPETLKAKECNAKATCYTKETCEPKDSATAVACLAHDETACAADKKCIFTVGVCLSPCSLHTKTTCSDATPEGGCMWKEKCKEIATVGTDCDDMGTYCGNCVKMDTKKCHYDQECVTSPKYRIECAQKALADCETGGRCLKFGSVCTPSVAGTVPCVQAKCPNLCADAGEDCVWSTECDDFDTDDDAAWTTCPEPEPDCSGSMSTATTAPLLVAGLLTAVWMA